MIFRTVSPLFVLFYLSSAQATKLATHNYTVNLNKNLTGLSVKACFAGDPPEKLVSYNDTQKDFLQHAFIITEAQKKISLRTNSRSIPLPVMQQQSCVLYDITFNDTTTHPWFKKQQANADQVLLDIHNWLWFPNNFNIDLHALDISFNLPEGLEVSAPWKIIDQRSVKNTKQITYRFEQRPPGWAGSMAIGRFKKEIILKGSSQIELAILNAKPPFKAESLMPWIHKNLDALLMTYGEFPVPRLQLVIVPVGKGAEPVPWGEAMHGGGDSVHLYIDQTRPIKEFMDDWVLIHELSHILHPRFHNATWLGEGMASYYQNVLRARSGLLTRQTAWQKLHEGFQRGIAGTPANKTLHEVSFSMKKTRAFMRVYWSGAAISLLADIKLRQHSNNRQSLDSAMKTFKNCCLGFNRKWTSHEFMQKMDSLTSTDIFSTLNKQYLHSTEFPDLTEAYNELGLSVKNNKVQLNSHARHAFIRDAIMQNTHEQALFE